MILQVIVHPQPDASPFDEVHGHLGRAPQLACLSSAFWYQGTLF